MCTKIAGIEKPLTIRFNQKGVGISGRMVDEVWRDCDRTNAERLPGGDVSEIVCQWLPPEKCSCCIDVSWKK